MIKWHVLVSLECRAESMTVTLNTEEPFTGRLFSQGGSKCQTLGTARKIMDLQFPTLLCIYKELHCCFSTKNEWRKNSFNSNSSCDHVNIMYKLVNSDIFLDIGKGRVQKNRVIFITSGGGSARVNYHFLFFFLMP